MDKNKIKELRNLWKENGIVKSLFQFSCGGDEMGSLEGELNLPTEYSDNLPDSTKTEILSLLEDLIYDKVEFYVNSDGHYIGEFGTVEVRLNSQDKFEFTKETEAETSEVMVETGDIELTLEQTSFLSRCIQSITVTSNETFMIQWKEDRFVSEEEEFCLHQVKEAITDFMDNLYQITECEIEDEGITVTTDPYVLEARESSNTDLELINNKLTIHYEYRYSDFSPDTEFYEE